MAGKGTETEKAEKSGEKIEKCPACGQEIKKSEFTQKAIAEPINSKMQPQKRKPTTDFGGESEISGSGSHSNLQDLSPSETEKTG